MVRRKKPKYQRPARELKRGRTDDAELLLGAPKRGEALADIIKAQTRPLDPREECTVINRKGSVIFSTEFANLADYWFKPPEEYYRTVCYNRFEPPPPARDFFEFRDRQLKFKFMEDNDGNGGDKS